MEIPLLVKTVLSVQSSLKVRNESIIGHSPFLLLAGTHHQQSSDRALWTRIRLAFHFADVISFQKCHSRVR
jgi:hypothetical protein